VNLDRVDVKGDAFCRTPDSRRVPKPPSVYAPGRVGSTAWVSEGHCRSSFFGPLTPGPGSRPLRFRIYGRFL